MARKFRDAKDREWTIALTIGRAREVLDATGIDLLQPEAGTPSLPEVLADEYKVASILEILLAGEFKRLGVDPKAVMDEDWDGKTTRAAYDAFLQELSAFFEDRGQLPRSQIVRKTTQAISTAMDVIGERTELLDPAAEVRRLVKENDDARIAGNTSGRPQGASVSTPVT
jgi:hypothetical protein